MPNDILITGAGGQLGSVLLLTLIDRGREATGTVSLCGPRPSRGRVLPLDLTNADAVTANLRSIRPRRIVHTAAITGVGDCYRDPRRTQAVNVGATRLLVELAAELGALMTFTSTDLVFDGTTGGYTEDNRVSPTSNYARSKVEAESIVRDYSRGGVVRLPLMYGLPGAPRETTFVQQLRALRDRQPLRFFADEFRSPLALADAAHSLVRLLDAGFVGIMHAAGPQRLSRLDMGRLAAEAIGITDPAITAVSRNDGVFDEPRPADVSLDSGRFIARFSATPGRTMREALVPIVDAFRSGRESI